jgi:hypothetical protein
LITSLKSEEVEVVKEQKVFEARAAEEQPSLDKNLEVASQRLQDAETVRVVDDHGVVDWACLNLASRRKDTHV